MIAAKEQYLVITLLLFMLFHSIRAQEGRVIQKKAIAFQLTHSDDTIDFIVVDTILDQKKPIFLWCQGSLPQPLFGELEGRGYFFQGGGIANFDYQKILEQYHLVVISMPKTPVVVPKENLSPRFLYQPDPDKPNEFSEEYIKADFLSNYVKRGNTVIEFLYSREWVDTEELVVAGASQGTKVATKIAVSNPLVTHLGLFSANPFGRIDQFVRQPRLDAQLGHISWEKADSLMNQQYDFFRKANNQDSINSTPWLNAWKTFSEPFYDDWLSMDIPIYLAYGTEDRTSDLCDIVPLFFISANKDNLTLKRHLHLEHNFFEVEEDGSTNYDKGHWEDVMNEFLDWLDKTNSKQ